MTLRVTTTKNENGRGRLAQFQHLAAIFEGDTDETSDVG